MSSQVIAGSLYRVKPERVDRFGPFRYRFLVEGDSWMDMSGAASASLPHFLVDEFNRRGVSALFINIAAGGDTLRRIEETIRGDLGWWLAQDRYDGILFSAGGNDLIDAARDPDPGQGLLRDMAGQPAPADAMDCVDPAALDKLVHGYLAPNFNTVHDAIRASPQNALTPLFLNCYDTATARNAPAGPGIGPWLYEAYRKNGIAPSLWPDLTAGLFTHLRKTIENWPTGRPGVHAVPTSGLLTPAAPGTTGRSGDWENEIHPSRSGWRKLAPVWADRILASVRA